jgi:hypothetical protein
MTSKPRQSRQPEQAEQEAPRGHVFEVLSRTVHGHETIHRPVAASADEARQAVADALPHGSEVVSVTAVPSL